MSKYEEFINFTGDYNYDTAFWDSMRGIAINKATLDKGRDSATDTFRMPESDEKLYMTALKKESIFRSLASVIRIYGDSTIFAKEYDDIAAWIPEAGTLPEYDGTEDFTKSAIETHKLANIVRLNEDFVHDMQTNMKDYLVKRLARNFGYAEEDAFINGTGTDMPTGILDDTNGAQVGVTATALTADDIIKLFFSVKPEYRRNAVWMMNDETALTLRTLKDDAGNYLWRSTDDSLLGHKVVISNYMPSAASGKKPVAFGDFGYYWIIGRKPLCVRTLKEKVCRIRPDRVSRLRVP